MSESQSTEGSNYLYSTGGGDHAVSVGRWHAVGSHAAIGNSAGKHYVVAVELVTFIDEAGALTINDRQKKWCFLDGYVAEMHAWDVFNEQWCEACTRLLPDGVDWFHAADFFSRTKSGRRHVAYRGWSAERDQALIDELVGIIRKHPLQKVGAAVDVQAFREYSVGERHLLTGGVFQDGRFISRGVPDRPYFVPFQTLVSRVNRLTPPDGIVHFVFCKDPKRVRHSERVFEQIAQWLPWSGLERRLGGLQYRLTCQEPGLQAADLRAHLWDQIFERATEVDPLRLAAAKQLEDPDRTHGVYDQNAMEAFFTTKMPPEVRAQLRAVRR